MESTTTVQMSAPKRNIMGTTSFDMKIKGMNKPQDFIVYPMQKGGDNSKIMIQSDKRIGYITLATGECELSANHANGAYFHSLQIDRMMKKTVSFVIPEIDLQALKLHIFASQGSKVGESVVLCDNSQAATVI